MILDWIPSPPLESRRPRRNSFGKKPCGVEADRVLVNSVDPFAYSGSNDFNFDNGGANLDNFAVEKRFEKS